MSKAVIIMSGGTRTHLLCYTRNNHNHLPIQSNLKAIGGLLLVKKVNKSRDKRISATMSTMLYLAGHSIFSLIRLMP